MHYVKRNKEKDDKQCKLEDGREKMGKNKQNQKSLVFLSLSIKNYISCKKYFLRHNKT